MTKQHRFTMYQNTIYDKGNMINPFECMKLLNQLNDENEQLKSICQDHKDHAIDFKADCVRLEKENEQLKFQLQSTSDQRDEFYRGARENANRVGKLKKDNEQLKSDLDYFKAKNGSLEIGLFNLERENKQLKQELQECKDKFNHLITYGVNR